MKEKIINNTLLTYICEDGTEVKNPDDCPDIPPIYVCEDGSIAKTPEDCPIKTKINYIFISIVLALLIGMGFLIYRLIKK